MTPHELSFDHLKRLTTDIGIYQHCQGSDPHLEHGYSIDDVARALIVCVKYYQKGIETDWCRQSIETHFNFIKRAQLEDGWFHNFADDQGNFLDSVGSEDSFGRTVWALGELLESGILNYDKVYEVYSRALNSDWENSPLRSLAFIGLGCFVKEETGSSHLFSDFYDQYNKNRDINWHWFESMMTYENARLPQVLLRFVTTSHEWENRAFYIGRESLDFLLDTVHDRYYSAIGNERLDNGNWFTKGESDPPMFDQQPVDIGALVEACVEAHKASRAMEYDYNGYYLRTAHEVYEWYFGKNIHKIPVYNVTSGGVHDALTREGVNDNQGAESILSIHLAKLAIDEAEKEEEFLTQDSQE